MGLRGLCWEHDPKPLICRRYSSCDDCVSWNCDAKSYHFPIINLMPTIQLNTRQHYTDDALLFQQHGRSAHEGDPSPVPDHDDEDAGCEECLHGKPHFGEASVLMDALRRTKKYLSYACYFIGKRGLKLTLYHSIA